MPTVFRSGPYRFFFYASDGNEPAHIHVERDDQTAKFWLQPVRVERSRGFILMAARLMRFQSEALAKVLD